MPTVSGSVLFNTSNTLPATGTGINNVPVVIRNTTSGVGRVALTNASGAFTFNNVPSGSYVLVEAWGTTGGTTSTVDFTGAGTITAPTPSDPPIASMPSQPNNANSVQSLSPNTINITMAAANISGQNFIDGPLANTALNIPDVTLIGTNLITDAGNGAWGSNPAGTVINTRPDPAPYPGVVRGFTYSATNQPSDGNYSIFNINTNTYYSVWWNMADHTTRNETGRYQLIGGSSPGSSFFTSTISVAANNTYYLSFWIANLINTTGYADPQVRVALSSTGGATIYGETLPSIPPLSVPQWREVSTFLSVGNNSQVVLDLISNGPGASGNDFAIDDIQLTRATVDNIVSHTFTRNRDYVDVLDDITYTIGLRNTGTSTISNIIISNTIPNGTTFNNSSVAVNGTTFAGFNPTPPGFTVTTPSIVAPNGAMTITFSIKASTIPSPNPIADSALIRYSITPIVGGPTVENQILSNILTSTVSSATIASSLSRNLAFVNTGDIITYTIPMLNYGTTLANNVVYLNTIPNGTTLVANSVSINGVTQTGASPQPPTGVSVGTIASGSTTTLSFQLLVTSSQIPNPNPIPNSAFIRYNYTSNPTIPSIKSATINTNIITSQFNIASLSSTKSVDRTIANIGDIVTYTIAMTNSGNVSANNIVFIDTIPSGTSIVTGSIVQDTTTVSGSINSPGVTLPNVIGPGRTSTVTFKVVPTTMPSPNTVQNAAFERYSYTVDPAFPNADSTTIFTNTVSTVITFGSLSGNVLFNTNNVSPTTGTGINNVPVILRNTTTGNGMIVLTNTIGAFTFSNVPAGNYTLVEGWGISGGVATPADFNNATIIAAATPSDPPIASMPTIPNNANSVQSLSPNTLNITMPNGNLTNQNFVDGPLIQVGASSTIPDVVVGGSNLITTINNGNWGTLSNGTLVNSTPSTNPYSNMASDYTYTNVISSTLPVVGSYAISNVTNVYNWWFNIADHTSRNETGRFMIASGTSNVSVLFSTTISVTANSYFRANLWGASLVALSGNPLPQLGLRVLDANSVTIFSRNFPTFSLPSVPTWVQLSTIFGVGNRTQVNVQIINNAAGAGVALDDFEVLQATPNTIITTTITNDRVFADVGDTINYTVAIQNTGQSSALNIRFEDTIPNGTIFNTGSVRINGTAFPSLSPIPPGFTLPNPATISNGQIVTITFNVNVTTIPSPNPVSNTTRTTYSFVPMINGDTITQTILSNVITTTVSAATISASKSRDLAFATFGSIITYTIPILNYGTTLANNVIVIDTLPSGTTLVANSVVVNGVTQSGATTSGINLGTISVGALSTVSFRALVTSTQTPTTISNSAFISYNYTANTTTPIVKSANANTNIVTTQFNLATISTVKSINKDFAAIGEVLTYTIALTNRGNVTASNIVFMDTIPSGTTFVTNSLKQDSTTISGSLSSPGITLPNNLGVSNTTTISFMVTVNTIPSPNPIPNSGNIRFTYTTNPSSPNDSSLSVNTNTVNTQVNNASFSGIRKYVDKISTYMGDILTYTIVAPNSGNTTALNVIFRDTIPNGTTFISNSVTVNGVTISGANPATGISLSNIGPGGISTITFKITVSG